MAKRFFLVSLYSVLYFISTGQSMSEIKVKVAETQLEINKIVHSIQLLENEISLKLDTLVTYNESLENYNDLLLDAKLESEGIVATEAEISELCSLKEKPDLASASIISPIRKGIKVKLLYYKIPFYKAEYKGKTGYFFAKYINQTADVIEFTNLVKKRDEKLDAEKKSVSAVASVSSVSSKSKSAATQCLGIAKSTGVRCKNRTKNTNGFCYVHQSQIGTNKNSKSSKTKKSYSGRCMATTKAGTRCKRNAASGSNYCWQH